MKGICHASHVLAMCFGMQMQSCVLFFHYSCTLHQIQNHINDISGIKHDKLAEVWMSSAIFLSNRKLLMTAESYVPDLTLSSKNLRTYWQQRLMFQT